MTSTFGQPSAPLQLKQTHEKLRRDAVRRQAEQYASEVQELQSKLSTLQAQVGTIEGKLSLNQREHVSFEAQIKEEKVAERNCC